ncbi:MAG TPA: FAD/NAD(P)-binding oxidoreductase [Gaiellales bacterium]|jgi:NADPH-dependent 2,4-dienoyl-CoA reductase/sulfur reductase-like enzyme|nr:FAD/NAD(P)-binding oxidoreductase [Gaiellales bacterium]
MTDRIVIVGGGLAAARVARAFRDAGGEGPLTILSADTDPPYNRPPLSKGFLRGEIEAAGVFVEPEETYTELGIDLRLGTEVTGVRPADRTVELTGGESLGYDRLVLASGSLPRALGTPGETLEGVHTYRTLRDASAVRAAAESASSALVIGGGFIGMETTASLRRRGLEVTQVDLADDLYASLQAPPLSQSLERLYRERGVEVILGDVVAEFRGSGGKLTGAVTKAGREIEAELAIVGVGVQPSTGYLEGSGVELEKGMVLVDERFATSVPGIWAVGDLASFEDPIFGHRRVCQHWTNANHQGDRLGRLLAGQNTPYDQVAFFFSEVFGTKIGLLGDLDGGHDELVMRGSLEVGALIGWYLRDDRLAAALIVGQTPDVQNQLNALLRVQARLVDRNALTDPEASPGEAFDATSVTAS